MRQLLYIPLVHEPADLGSAGEPLVRESARLVGERRWSIHQEAMARFWEQVTAVLNALEPHQIRVYQDGLPAGGKVGMRIVEEAARRGSRNHALIRDLIGRGAELRKTEAPELLLQEHQRLLGISYSPPNAVAPKGAPIESSRTQADRLLRERNEFIADTINATLREGEIGVLFIGAYHDVASRLAPDIVVQYIRDPAKVKAYFQALFSERNERTFAELARDLQGA